MGIEMPRLSAPLLVTFLYVREKLQQLCYKCHNPQHKIHLPGQPGAWNFNTSDSVKSLVLKKDLNPLKQSTFQNL